MEFDLKLGISDYIVSQIREATFSPSPLIRILHDPTILPPDSSDYQRSRRDRNHNSSHRRRRTEVIAALAIAEEEKQSRQLKSLLRMSGERLEYEIKRADAATVRADMAERQEKIYRAKARTAEAEKEEIGRMCNELERELRNYQVELEESQRELKMLLANLRVKSIEMEELYTSFGLHNK